MDNPLSLIGWETGFEPVTFGYERKLQLATGPKNTNNLQLTQWFRKHRTRDYITHINPVCKTLGYKLGYIIFPYHANDPERSGGGFCRPSVCRHMVRFSCSFSFG